MTIVPFTDEGFYYEAVSFIENKKEKWRIMVRVVKGQDFLFNNDTYPEATCKGIVDEMNFQQMANYQRKVREK